MSGRTKEVLVEALDEPLDTQIINPNTLSTPINPMPHFSLKYTPPTNRHTSGLAAPIQPKLSHPLDMPMYVSPARREIRLYRARDYSL